MVKSLQSPWSDPIQPPSGAVAAGATAGAAGAAGGMGAESSSSFAKSQAVEMVKNRLS